MPAICYVVTSNEVVRRRIDPNAISVTRCCYVVIGNEVERRRKKIDALVVVYYVIFIYVVVRRRIKVDARAMSRACCYGVPTDDGAGARVDVDAIIIYVLYVRILDFHVSYARQVKPVTLRCVTLSIHGYGIFLHANSTHITNVISKPIILLVVIT